MIVVIIVDVMYASSCTVLSELPNLLLQHMCISRVLVGYSGSQILMEVHSCFGTALCLVQSWEQGLWFKLDFHGGMMP